MADLKFIVTELNKLINTDYNLISFDALPIANLMQIMVDVLHNFGALVKVCVLGRFCCCFVVLFLMMCEMQSFLCMESGLRVQCYFVTFSKTEQNRTMFSCP